MANQRNAIALLVIAALTVVVGGTGLYLGFQAGRHPQSGPPVPKAPDIGPIIFDMRSIRSDPDRVRFEWKHMDGAQGYRVTVLSAANESLFASTALTTNAWVIPADLSKRLTPQTVYHWKVTVLTDKGDGTASDPTTFATQ
ncbi:MAG TPA: hypothetical protein VK123_08145 [Candidatus Limnocylindrales bacterium]|nr:hypothetical protein [Candidatus Limnocylindrales bacterium]